MRAALRAGGGQPHRQREAEVEGGQVAQERTDLGGRNRGIGGDGEKFRGEGMERTQDVEAVTARGRPQEDPGQGPEKPQERSSHTGRGIDNEDGALPRTGLGSARFPLVPQGARLHVGIGLGGEPGDTPTAEREFF